MLIAIDGPSGSGKSTTARGVAKRLGLAYLDTGAMYRAITCAQLAAGVSGDDADGIAHTARCAQLEIHTHPDHPRICVNGTDVTQTIREPQISACVSAGATNLEVRRVLTDQMRELIAQHGRNMVVEGRDITTVVAPDADVRVLLIADPAARIARRAAELGDKADAAAVTDSIVRRDRDDSTVSNFTIAANGVVVIDSTFLTPDEVIAQIVALATPE